MRFNVAQLLKEPVGSTRQYDIEADIATLDEEISPLGPLTGHVRFLRTDAGILVQGRVQAKVSLQCSRCLAPLVVPLEVELEEEYRPRVPLGSVGKRSDEDEDPALFIDEHQILDLGEVVRQELLLALPIHPLCRPDCAGLCPECGQDLNEGPCECVRAMDPRWAALELGFERSE
ncbi:MAG: DUF177 domain-containing protein [Anaerolineae bacterium]|nr:DUF177 domain-containing protein [Anaerolineae bacterium]